jgi:hypothetical protein
VANEKNTIKLFAPAEPVKILQKLKYTKNLAGRSTKFEISTANDCTLWGASTTNRDDLLLKPTITHISGYILKDWKRKFRKVQCLFEAK